MKFLCMGFLLSLGMPARAAPSITLEILGKEIWTLEIQDQSIRGDRNVLNRDDRVIFGFVGGKPARLKQTADRVFGRLSGHMVSFTLEQGPGHTKLAGILDRDRLFAEVSGKNLQLWDHSLRIELKPESPDTPDTPHTLSDKRGMVKLVFTDCDIGLAHDRPELLVMLHRLVLPRVMQLEDIPFHFRAGNSPDESRVYRRFNPQPTPMVPHRQRHR